MEILEAFDLTRCAHSAAQLAGVDEKTVARYVAIRDRGGDPLARPRRVRSIDPFLAKVEEWVDHSKGKIRADVVHQRLVAMGFGGTDRSTRRAVAEVKTAWKAGNRRSYRPWIPEPGMWLQFDWGEGPRIGERRTQLFCAWLAWSRFRVVLPAWDQTLGTLVACLDATLRRLGGAPTYVLTDNPKTVTMDRIAGVAVRHPDIVAAGRHYGCKVETCQPFDPESKGGAEHTVKIAKADLVPTTANLLDAYSSFVELSDACVQWCERVNARTHRETGAALVDRIIVERRHLHVLPGQPHAVALGAERLVDDDQTIRFGSVRYSTPPGHVGSKVWCRVVGEELVIVARTSAGLGGR
jgi:transposase